MLGNKIASLGDEVTIVALLGSSGSGKSTVAQHLINEHGFTRVRFAQTLKDMLVAMGATIEQVDGPQAVRMIPDPLLCGKSWRYAMQTLGTEWRNHFGKELWSNIAYKRIEQLIDHGHRRFVIDDMRFLHEAKQLHEIGGYTLAVRRPTVEPRKRDLFVSKLRLPKILAAVVHMLTGAKTMHVSETEWLKIPIDIEVRNTLSLVALYQSVDHELSLEYLI